MTDLPKPSELFTGEIDRLYGEASPRKLNLDQPAKGKPNVLLVMLDDVGFGSFSAFGGLIQVQFSWRCFSIEPADLSGKRLARFG